MTTITRDMCRAIDADLKAALAIIAAKHGLGVKVNGGRFDNNTFSPRVEFAVAGDVGVCKKDEDNFKHFAHLYGLEEGDLGKTFPATGGPYRIDGLFPGRSKNTVKLTRLSDGKTMKATVDFVKAGLGRVDINR